MGKILDNPDEVNVLHKSLKRRTFLSCGERRSLTVKGQKDAMLLREGVTAEQMHVTSRSWKKGAEWTFPWSLQGPVTADLQNSKKVSHLCVVLNPQITTKFMVMCYVSNIENKCAMTCGFPQLTTPCLPKVGVLWYRVYSSRVEGSWEVKKWQQEPLISVGKLKTREKKASDSKRDGNVDKIILETKKEVLIMWLDGGVS